MLASSQLKILFAILFRFISPDNFISCNCRCVRKSHYAIQNNKHWL